MACRRVVGKRIPLKRRDEQGCFKFARGNLASALLRKGLAVPSLYRKPKNAMSEFSLLTMKQRRLKTRDLGELVTSSAPFPSSLSYSTSQF
jgi:hypothetical protein